MFSPRRPGAVCPRIFVPATVPSSARGHAEMDRDGRIKDDLHRARLALGEWLRRELGSETSFSTARHSTRSVRPKSSSRAGAAITMQRPHQPLGYRPPAPEVFVPSPAAWPHTQATHLVYAESGRGRQPELIFHVSHSAEGGLITSGLARKALT
jgi:hypothetical protein